MTGGNLRLLTRLLTQLERLLGVNDTQSITVEIVDAARDSLVIGQLKAWHLRQIIPQNLGQTIPHPTLLGIHNKLVKIHGSDGSIQNASTGSGYDA
jgi:hypothetical protein